MAAPTGNGPDVIRGATVRKANRTERDEMGLTDGLLIPSRCRFQNTIDWESKKTFEGTFGKFLSPRSETFLEKMIG